MHDINQASTYFDLDDTKCLFTNKSTSDISVVHLNAVSLIANFDSITLFLEKLNLPDAICISETRLRNEKIDYQKNLVDIPGYELMYHNSPTNAGGVAIYIKMAFKPKIVNQINLVLEDTESLFLELEISPTSNKQCDKSLLLGCIYRHPRPSTKTFTDKLYELLHDYSNRNIPLVVVGDINIDVSLNNNDCVQYYNNTLLSIGCKNLINLHTRFSANTRSTLDHIITNLSSDNVQYGVINEPITDHLPIFCIIRDIRCDSNKVDKDEKIMWRFIDESKKDFFLSVLEDNLKNVNLDLSPDELLESLTQKTQKAIEKCFPLRIKSNRAKKRSLTPWFGSDIYKGITARRKLWKKFTKSGSLDDYCIYKIFRSKLSKNMYKAKKKYFQELLQDAKDKGDKTKVWEIINKAFGKSKSAKIFPEKIQVDNGGFSTGGQDIANSMNTHFTTVGEKLAEKLEKNRHKF